MSQQQQQWDTALSNGKPLVYVWVMQIRSARCPLVVDQFPESEPEQFTPVHVLFLANNQITCVVVVKPGLYMYIRVLMSTQPPSWNGQYLDSGFG